MSPVLLALLGLVLAPALLAVVFASLRQPMRIGLPIFAALIPFGKGVAIGPTPFGSLSSLAGLVLAAGLLLQLVSSRGSSPRIPVDTPIWFIFFGVAAASALWSIHRATTLAGVEVLGSLVVVYALVALSHVDRGILRRTENALMAGATVAVCYGLVQLFLLGGFPENNVAGLRSPKGRFGNDLLGNNLEAVALILPLVLALDRAVTEPRRSRRAGYGLLVALLLVGVLMTASRTGTLAIAVAVGALALASPQRARKRVMAYLSVGGVAAALVWIYHPGNIAVRTFDSVTSSSGRSDIWQVGLEACRKYCAAGSGWGTFPDVYADTQSLVPGARVLVGTGGSYQAHNLWLLAVVELGAAGLVLLVAGFVVSLSQAARLPETRRGPALGALVGLIVAVCFLSSMEFKFFWMTLMFVAMNRNLTETEPAPETTGSAPRAAPSTA
jgi:O-antigen ligase